jgi:hypothetical protein
LKKIFKTKNSELSILKNGKYVQIAEKGRKRPKINCRPNADLDKLKRPNWSETTKYGNTESVDGKFQTDFINKRVLS